MISALLVAVLVAPVAGKSSLGKISLESDPAAVCTDGSPAAYYYKPTMAPDQPTRASETWIVYLQGGGWCYDDASCRDRCGDPKNPSTDKLCSSKGYKDEQALEGIFYPSNNEDLNNAQKAFVPYCTSDGHMGNGEAFGFQFRGEIVVRAVLKDLVARRGLGSGVNGRRDRLIFGGGSAGARGGMVHLDYVSGMLGDAAQHVEVVGFLDSPAWVDKAPYPTSSFPGFVYITQAVHSYANVSHLGEACPAKYPGAESWKCMFGQYRLPTLKTRYFLVASQYDSYQLSNNVGHEPASDGEKAYSEDVAAAMRNLVGAVVAMPEGNFAYSWSCYNHDVSGSDAGFNTHTCGSSATTMGEAFKQFLGWDAVATPLVADTCTTFECGTGCSSAWETFESAVSGAGVESDIWGLQSPNLSENNLPFA